MALKLIGNLLGLGSIVKIETDNNSGLYVVLARGAMREGEDEAVPRDLVGPHQFGEAPDQVTFPLIDSEIEEVVFEGYTDEADEEFLKDLLYQMENGRRPSKVASQFKEALTEIPEAEESDEEVSEEMTMGKIDPFYKLRSLAQ